jgi:DNA-binding NarL/FixJ family response regulator
MSATRIVLADDHALVRAGIRALLEGIDGLVVVGEASDGRQAVELSREHHPDLVVMDISMNELNGIEAAARIKADFPATHVLILSMHTSEEFVRRAMKSGVSGYLVKDSAPLELRMAVEAVMSGSVYLSPRISRHLVSHMVDGPAQGAEIALDALTARQREVLQMIAEGKTTKQMAFALKLSGKTVETHRAALMDRLAIHDLAGLVIYAVRHKLVGLEPR